MNNNEHYLEAIADLLNLRPIDYVQNSWIPVSLSFNGPGKRVPGQENMFSVEDKLRQKLERRVRRAKKQEEDWRRNSGREE